MKGVSGPNRTALELPIRRDVGFLQCQPDGAIVSAELLSDVVARKPRRWSLDAFGDLLGGGGPRPTCIVVGDELGDGAAVHAESRGVPLTRSATVRRTCYRRSVAVARTYDEFRAQLMDRHVNVWTRRLSTVGDVLYVASIPAGLIARNFRVFLVVSSTGSFFEVAAHFFQPGTVKNEVASVLRHPVWALQAETARVFGRS